MCQQLSIDHNLLVLREPIEFKDSKNNEISNVRYNFYNKKRLKLLNIIEKVMLDYATNP